MEISIIPRFLIKKISDNHIHQINWNILLSTILILLILMIVNISVLDMIPHFCLFEWLTGVPCPACGITRSVLCIYDFQIVESLKFNPNGILISSLFILQIPMRIIALINERHFIWIDRLSGILTRILISTMLIYWFYNIINLKF